MNIAKILAENLIFLAHSLPPETGAEHLTLLSVIMVTFDFEVGRRETMIQLRPRNSATLMTHPKQVQETHANDHFNYKITINKKTYKMEKIRKSDFL